MLHYEPKRVRQHRETLMLTVDEVAKRARLSSRGVRSIEAGAVPNARTLARLASAMRLQVGAFFVVR